MCSIDRNGKVLKRVTLNIRFYTYFEVVLVHAISVCDQTSFPVKLIFITREFFSETDLMNRVRHIELLESADTK